MKANRPDLARWPEYTAVAKSGHQKSGRAVPPLASVLNYWGRSTTVAAVTGANPPDRQRGIFAGHLRDFARNRGLSAFLIPGTPADLNNEIALGRPVLVGLVKDQGHKVFGHYAVVVGLRRDGGSILIMDPAEGWRDQPLNTFLAEGGSRPAGDAGGLVFGQAGGNTAKVLNGGPIGRRPGRSRFAGRHVLFNV